MRTAYWRRKMRCDTLVHYDGNRELEKQIRRMEMQLPAGRLVMLGIRRRYPRLAGLMAEENRPDERRSM